MSWEDSFGVDADLAHGDYQREVAEDLGLVEPLPGPWVLCGPLDEESHTALLASSPGPAPERKPCRRCAGKGAGSWHADQGRCWACGGSGWILTGASKLEAQIQRVEQEIEGIEYRGRNVRQQVDEPDFGAAPYRADVLELDALRLLHREKRRSLTALKIKLLKL